MKHSINLVKKFNKLSPRREYIYRWERGQWYDGYDEHMVSFKEYTVTCHGMMSGGKSILLLSAKESPTGKAITASPKKVKLLYHVSGWTKVAPLYPHG